MSLRYLSVCSGIEAATVAWHPLGWTPVGFAEIDKFASAVLAARFGSNMPGEPLASNGVPNFGDFTSIDLTKLGPVDLLVGGTPCQAFSFAGKRQSLADARGNLTLAYAVLAHELARSHGLTNALWENVPGVLSTDDNAFGCFLGAIVGADDALPLPDGVERWPDAGMVAGPRARAAWRLLDAQYFGLAQRRERVFVVVDFGGGADPAAVLFEPQGLQGNTPPSREARKDVAGTLSARTEGGGGLGTDFDLDGGLIAGTLGCRSADHPSGLKSESDFIVPVDMTNGNVGGQVAGTLGTEQGHGNRGQFIIAPETAHGADRGDQDTLIAAPIAFAQNQRDEVRMMDVAGSLAAEPGAKQQTYIATPPAYAIQAGALRENPDSGPDGLGVQSDHAYTLEARAEVQAVVFQPRFARNDRGAPDTIASALTAEAGLTGKGDSAQCVAYPIDMRQASRGEKMTNNRKEGSTGGAPGTGIGNDGDPSPTVAASHVPAVCNGWAVRRLTTVECARLQGFPDHHSQIAWRGKPPDQCPDGPQYKTYGNSMAVKNMRWLGDRIQQARAAMCSE